MKKIGILGGMGPEATKHFYSLIINNTPAEMDQDHIPTVIISDPRVPDRQKAILTKNYKEVNDFLIKQAQYLIKCDANFICVPCNTAHFFFKHIQPYISIPIINMIDLTAQEITKKINDYKDNKNNKDNKDNKDNNIINNRIGLLATTGLINTGVYDSYFAKFGLELVKPNPHEQNLLMKVIFDGIKKNGPSTILKNQINEITKKMLNDFDLKWVILGCTELPLLFEGENLEKIGLVDPMELLAKNAVERAIN